MPPPRRTTLGSPDGSGLTTTWALLLESTDETASRYNTALPPFRICGDDGTGPPFCTTVSRSTCPPAAGTRERPSDEANTIVLSAPHDPPRGEDTAHSVTMAPPMAGIFLSDPSTKNAIHSPSGEKNGAAPPSVPSSTWASRRSRRRAKSRVRVERIFSGRATNASVVPSGDIASDGVAAESTALVPSCASTRTGAGEGVFRHGAQETSVATRPATAVPATAHGTTRGQRSSSRPGGATRDADDPAERS